MKHSYKNILINLCAHDGIISHYTGVGSIVKDYIHALTQIISTAELNITLNLFTPEYLPESFGYSSKTEEENMRLSSQLSGAIFQISNGSSGARNYGFVEDWQVLVRNTAQVINSLDIEKYDTVLNLYNDTPFAQLAKHLSVNDKIRNFWIPHSTIKIHGVDSAVDNDSSYFDMRLAWEQETIDFINHTQYNFVITIGQYIREHLIKEFHLNHVKAIDLFNGRILQSTNVSTSLDEEVLRLVGNRKILLTFGRAEPYKNLEYSIKLGNLIDDPQLLNIVIAQGYGGYMGIYNDYKKLNNGNTLLYLDPPFDFVKKLLALPNDIAVIVPSIAETMGLIINEIRVLDKDNIAIVANNTNGLAEQIENNIDGFLIECTDANLEKNAKFLKDLLLGDSVHIKQVKKAGIVRVEKDYDLLKNVQHFLATVLE
jgi:glycosyltransferase involved in cell wall biosynthesis